ncbi:MAG TPA: hypothetical protein VKA10_07930 [Prolixibacteraceae bacterium]|nr:hypothetical protein [Prolixibacteraceae bacterium]
MNDLKTKPSFMKCYFLILALLVFSVNGAFAQNPPYPKDFKSYKKKLKDEFNVVAKNPESFTELERQDYIMLKIGRDKSKHTGTMFGPVFISEDENCLLMYGVRVVQKAKQNQGWRLKRGISSYPRSQIKAEIGTALETYYGPHNPKNQ